MQRQAIDAPPPLVEHHSAHLRRDREGRFIAAKGTSHERPRRRRRIQEEEEAAVVPFVLHNDEEDDDEDEEAVLPYVSPGFAPQDAHAQPSSRSLPSNRLASIWARRLRYRFGVFY